MLESNDIIGYLDEQFPEPPLQSGASEARKAMTERIAEASAFQSTIKVLSHELLFRPFRIFGAREIALYEKQHNDPALVEWVRDSVLKRDFGALNRYFPPEATRPLTERWKNVTKALESDGLIQTVPDFGTQHWEDFKKLV